MSFVLGLNESSDSLYIQRFKNIQKQGKTVFVRNAESDDVVFTFQYIGKVITDFEIPISGTYKIEAWGASGGGLNTAPKGAYSKSFVYLNKSERIQILVGEKGYDGYNNGDRIYCAGGGGGSFVAKGETPLCVAGGGGGNGYKWHDNVSSFACGQSGQYGGDPKSRQVQLTYGGSASYYTGGGGGFRYNGNNPKSTGKGGISFLNGGWRTNVSAYSGVSYGGFGGGGSTHGNCGGAAGGGGYTGGGGGYSVTQGGGGGSYFTGTYGEANSMAISGCDSFPTKPTSDLNGNVVLTIMSVISDSNNCRCSLCRCMSISWALFFFNTYFFVKN